MPVPGQALRRGQQTASTCHWCPGSRTLVHKHAPTSCWLAWADKHVDGLDEVAVALLLVMQGLQGRAAKVV